MPSTFSFEDAVAPPEQFAFEDAAPKTFSFDEAIKTPEFDAESAQQPVLTPEERETASAPWYKPPAEWSKPLIGEIKVPSGANTAIPGVTIPAASVARAAAGVVNYFQTPQGITEILGTLTPAAPVVYAKWAKDMAEGGLEAVKGAAHAFAGIIQDALTRKAIDLNQLGVPKDAGEKEINEKVQDLSDNIVQGVLMAGGALGAAKGAVAEAKYLPTRLNPRPELPPEPKIQVEDRGRVLDELAQRFTDQRMAERRLQEEAQAQAESGSPFTRAEVPQEPVTMGVESGKVPTLGAAPTFEPSGLGRPVGAPAVDPVRQSVEQILNVSPVNPTPVFEGSHRVVRSLADQQVRNADFSKAVAEKVLQEHEAPVHPDKPLTDNQIRIIRDSLTQAIADNQIPGTEKGLIVGSALEKWADETIKNAGQKFYTGGMVELTAAALVKGAALLEKGITEFSKWSAEMVREFGDKIRPHMRQLYLQATEERAKAFQKPQTIIQQAPSKPSVPLPPQTPPPAPLGPTARPFGAAVPPRGAAAPPATPPAARAPQAPAPLTHRLAPREVRARFSEIGKDSPAAERFFTETVNAGVEARDIIERFMRTAFGRNRADQERLARDFVALGRDNRRIELQSRGLPATQVPALTPQEAARIRSDPQIQAAIQYWNREVAPTIADIRTRNQMIMSPNWNSMDLMINLPGEYNPAFQRRSGVNVNDVYNEPARGEGSMQADPVEALNQIVRGHLRYDASQKLASEIRQNVSINPANVVDPHGRANPTTFPAPRRGEYFEGPYRGRTVEVQAIDLSDNPMHPEFHYVPRAVAKEWNNQYQQRAMWDNVIDRARGMFISWGVLPGSFMPHVVREITAVAGRIGQSGQSWWSALPSWLGSNEYTLYRILHDMRETPYGHLMQRVVDRTGADRGTGYAPDPQTTIGRWAGFGHEALFNPHWGIDVLARRTIADAALMKRIGLDQMRQLERDVNAGTVTVQQALQQLERRLNSRELVSVGREVNNTMGYANPQTRANTLNWVQRILPFISSESGKIPDEIRRFTTANLDIPSMGRSVRRGDYAQAAKQMAGSLANGPVGVFMLMSVANYLITKAQTGNGVPITDNPQGRRTDIFLAPGWYWGNLDPGLERATRILQVREKVDTGHTDIGRELINEAFSVMAPDIRWLFTALSEMTGSGKTLYMTHSHELGDARASDLVPFSPTRNILNAAAQKKPVMPEAMKDVANWFGMQLLGKPTDPEKIEAAQRNSAIDQIARRAKRVPAEDRRDYVRDELEKRDIWDDRSRNRINRVYPGLYREDDE